MADLRDRLGRAAYTTGDTGWSLPFGWDGVRGWLPPQDDRREVAVRERCRRIADAVLDELVRILEERHAMPDRPDYSSLECPHCLVVLNPTPPALLRFELAGEGVAIACPVCLVGQLRPTGRSRPRLAEAIVAAAAAAFVATMDRMEAIHADEGEGWNLGAARGVVEERYLALKAALAAGEAGRPLAARPPIVCLCGSTRFWRDFQAASLRETLAGRIVLSIGAASGTDDDHFGNLPRDEYDRVKTQLDELHLRKIELADEVLILNVGKYIGQSTRRELDHARALGKPVRFLENPS